jgi:ArsR family transcriptional regulator, lead/cadmium/zinc/bismuth-responsive transcriptional repressor
MRDRCDLLCLDLPRAERIRWVMIDRDAAASIAARAAGLSDPTRLRLALALAWGGELCVCDLAWISGDAENLVSHHLRRLRDAGLAQARRDHKMVLYTLTAEGRKLLEALAPDQKAVST